MPDKGKDAESRRVELRSGSRLRFSSSILNGYGAPKLSELRKCGAPEIPEWRNYLGTLILNSIFSVHYDEGKRPIILNFIRRMEFAVTEYRRGREVLQKYVEELPERNNHFLGALRSLSHFEQSIASLYQAVSLYGALVGKKLFKKGDRSDLQRLNRLYSLSKHLDDPNRASPELATPIWLTNEGLECSEAVLSFDELVSIVQQLTKVAEAIADYPAHQKKRMKA